MSALGKELTRYLMIRRSLGYDLRTLERVLRRFVEFAERERAKHVTLQLFLRWRSAFGQASQSTWARRLRMVRGFTQWLHGLDPRHEVPAKSAIPARVVRTKPHIFPPEDIRRIVQEAAALPSIYAFRGKTFSTLFGLLAVTGLRISEAIALDLADVDLHTGVLTVRRGKLGKARLIPVSKSTLHHLSIYARERERLRKAKSDAFFISERGGRLTDCCVRYNFAVVSQRLGLRPPQLMHRHGRGPRVHDIRHTYTVQTLLSWYRTGKNPAKEMIKLSTMLGHTDPKHTYWYFEAVPELLALASKRVSSSMEKEALV